MLKGRLAQFRDQAQVRGKSYHSSPKEVNWNMAFFKLYKQLPLAERQAQSFAYALRNEPIYVFPLERIAGQTYQACEGAGSPEFNGIDGDDRWNEYSVTSTAREAIKKVFPDSVPYHKHFGTTGIPGHISWDYGIMLKLGIEGMIEKLEEHKKNTTDPKSIEYYNCSKIALGGLLDWTKKLVHALIDKAEESEPERRAELFRMADTCERVPARPARTFREALQCFYLQHLAVLFENPFGGMCPGRLDWYLWPYLKFSLDTGRITLGEARDLITELLIKLDERIHTADMWVEAIVAGGRNPDGTLSINPLSHIIVEAMLDLKNTHPSVYIRMPGGASPEFEDLAIRYMLESENRGQVYGDDAVIEALIKDGCAPEDARHWAAGGCMEVGVQGASGDLLFAFAHNVARTLELTMNGGKMFGSEEKIAPIDKTLADYTSFEELYQTFSDELARELDILLTQLDISIEHYAKYRPSFFLSTMVHDCMERGRTINDGGAKYPNYGGSGVGIPNVGDSLYALKRAIFDEKKYTGAEILEALRANYKGCKEMQTWLTNLPKFGSGRDKEAVQMVDRVLMDFSDNLKKRENPRGGHCRPVILGFVWVVDYGLKTGATPDGRNAGKPLAHGLAPQSGSATAGITAAIGDATQLSLDEIDGGASMMWDIDSDWAKPEYIGPILQTYIKAGGHIFQGNVTSVQQLIEAQKDPDTYRDLMIRVGGYSARFTTLTPETQQEIINRYKYGQ